MKSIVRHSLLAVGATLALSACVNIPYRAPVQQGNHIEADRAAALREGMSKTDVANIVGSPLVSNLLRANRWDYIYTLQKNHQARIQSRITLWFNNDGVVTKIERDIPEPAAK